MRSNKVLSIYDTLQIGRGLAALAVVGHHTTTKLELDSKFSGDHVFFNSIFQRGWLGVDFFFVLSGFIIALNLSKVPTISEFLYRRAIKIYLPFWIAFFLTATLAASLAFLNRANYFQAFEWYEWILALVLLPSGNTAPVIGVAWTLHHEVFFYLLAAFWLIFPRGTILFAALLLFSSVVFHTKEFPQSFFLSPLHWEFAIGIAAFLIHRCVTKGIAVASIILGFIWILTFELTTPAINDWHGSERVIHYGIGFGLLSLGFSGFERNASIRRNSRFKKLAVALGDSSYFLYLLHIPIILFTIRMGGLVDTSNSFVSVNLCGVIAIAVCIFVAFMFHFYVEKPVLKKLHRRTY